MHLRIGCMRFDGLFDPSLPPSSSGKWQELTRQALEVRPMRYSSLHSDAVRLLEAKWIKVERQRASASEIWRIYYLPDDVSLASIPRTSKILRRAFENVLMNLDICQALWDGKESVHKVPFELWATPDRCSLFYIFNTLKSPEPSQESIKDSQHLAVVKRLLALKSPCRGLRTSLYPYQRRAAAAMVQQETTPRLQLDPRLEARTAIDGTVYYYGPRDRTLLRYPRHYETVTGGILAETMGLGKTLICIATILASLGQLPKIPPQYPQADIPTRKVVGSLMDMAAAATTRHQLPWKGHFQDILESRGEHMARCIESLQLQQPEYVVPPRVIRENARRRSESIMSKPTHVLLSSGTIIVVPRNLVHQWRSEFDKHVCEDALKIFVVDAPKVFLPSPAELATFDVIIFSRPRFELENKQSEEFYESPLKAIHWLRIIIDEGHGFSSTNTHAVVAAEKLVKADRRWIVSGTPAKDLLGVEVELGWMADQSMPMTHNEYRQNSLYHRRAFNYQQEVHSGAVKSLGALASRFLMAQPWSNSDFLEHLESSAQWEDSVYRHEDLRARTYSSFSTCLRRTLQNLVIRTRPDDVERDLILPPLTHEIVRLQPSLYDKLTANLFVLLFTSNAITSERTDQDYLFHKNNLSHLHRLTTNLRQSGFAWSGFDKSSVRASLRVARSYLEKEGQECSKEDRDLMTHTMEVASLALRLPGWQALSNSQEVAVVLRNWPDDTRVEWSLEGCTDPMLMGLTQVSQAQRHVNARLSTEEPLIGFAEAGISAQVAAEEARIYATGAKPKSDADSSGMEKTGIPSSSVSMGSMGTKRLLVSGATTTSPRKPRRSNTVVAQEENASISPSKALVRNAKKRRLSSTDSYISLPPTSTIGSTQMVGTTSAKLTYLIDRVVTLHSSEKILIFYDAPHIAFYISQALDILHIKHLIYASTLSGEQRSKYAVLFDTDPSQRVLLMDLKQAAHGLNLSSASRVFFVNPALRPDIEAQAIKRAHRIGQTRPVRVETLLLTGTIEEAMHDHAAKMTRGEHLAAKTLEEDDGIRGIIQSARVMRVRPDEMKGEAQVATLTMPQQLFGRTDRRKPGEQRSGLEEEIFGAESRIDLVMDLRGVDDRTKPKRRRGASEGPGDGTTSTTNAREQDYLRARSNYGTNVADVEDEDAPTLAPCRPHSIFGSTADQN
ncbi:hypothetical protein FH972_023165 [Carpinus fangiana]|uniref:Helicase C-terminal domain-containing protein n=1 Tax=Carpinus fangiana TaxID=176857 RepID=A0A5N6KUT5_9ROSI|nr:hypothetical protein FH972_023165 [Carpinus fangiana]